MEKQSQAPMYAKALEAIPNDQREQILVLREDELQHISGGRGRTAGLFMSE
jgi:bacteriocin-like protein